MMSPDQPSTPFQGKSWNKFYEARDAQPVRPFLIHTLELFEQAGRPLGHAIELGCGQGIDTAELLSRGWSVLAIDSSDEGIARTADRADALELSERLESRCAKFEELESLPPADLVYAAMSLPFCPPEHFEGLWRKIRAAVRNAPGGWISAQFFGPNDTWADNPELSFHSRAEVEALFSDMEVRDFHERDEDGEAVSGPKHWHVFSVIASSGS